MGTAYGSRMKSLKPHLHTKKAKFVTMDIKANATIQSKKKGGFGEHIQIYLWTAKHKGKVRTGGPLHNATGNIMEESYPSGSDMLNDGDWRQVSKIGNNGRMRREPAERLDMPLSNV